MKVCMSIIFPINNNLEYSYTLMNDNQILFDKTREFMPFIMDQVPRQDMLMRQGLGLGHRQDVTGRAPLSVRSEEGQAKKGQAGSGSCIVGKTEIASQRQPGQKWRVKGC